MIRKGSNVFRLAGIAGLLACLLLAQLHASAHLHGAWFGAAGKRLPLQNAQGLGGPDCQCCMTSVWTAPAATPHPEAPSPGLWLDRLPQPKASSQEAFQLTASRAPPLA